MKNWEQEARQLSDLSGSQRRRIEELETEVEELRACIEATCEALIGDGVEFDSTSVGDELACQAPNHLVASLPRSVVAAAPQREVSP